MPRLRAQNQLVPGFTSRYNLARLVHYESFAYPDAAIMREKEIWGWRRSKKIGLIESLNPHGAISHKAGVNFTNRRGWPNSAPDPSPG
jgi:predicted GIY-YIG superfamily endonuclease